MESAIVRYNHYGMWGMSTPLLDLEGTAEEIQKRLAEFAGQRLHVTVVALEVPVDAPAEALPPNRTFTEKLLAIAEAMPADERARLPHDLADQHDHYGYGWSKR